MVRFLIILAIAGVAVVLLWPYLRRLDPAGERAVHTRRRGDRIFFVIALAVGLSFAASALLWFLAS